MKNKKGFTLIELLAVIVILAVILIIAVPKIMDVILESKKSSFIDSAKLVASNIEKKYQGDLAFGTTFNMGSVDNPVDCSTLISLDSDEYLSCYYYFDDNERVVVDIIGTDTGKFSGLRAIGSTKEMIVGLNYLVTFDYNGGSGSTTSKNVINNGTYGSLPVATKTGSTFTGWYLDNNKIESTSTVNITKDTTLVAHYDVNSYTITLSDNDSTTVSYGSDMPTITAPTKNGYLFVGYYTEENGLGTKYYNGDGTSANTCDFTNDITLYAYFVENVFTFDYTGSEQTFTAPYTGTYKLEVWGAQGGVSTSGSHLNFGGYSVGEITLTENDKLYINVGGQGETYKYDTETSYGGYNGGGNGGIGVMGGCGGGGATHIATTSGLLSTLSTNTNSVILVAGGGGGSTDQTNVYGGAGGGYIGNNGGYVSNFSYYHANGGTQTSGGNDNAEPGVAATFGQGADHVNNNYGGNGGGGGYYGGGGSSRHHSGGGGGSGYIGNTSLSNKAMYCYNCTTSNDTNTKTISTTCANENATSNCSKKNNGYAKLTLISVD